MSLQESQSEGNWLDTVFEGRNKSYGAYELRQKSSKRTILALILASLFFIALVLAIYFTNRGKAKVITKVIPVELKKLNKPKEPIKEIIVPKKEQKVIKKIKSPVDVKKLVPPLIVDKKVVAKEIEKTEEKPIPTASSEQKGDPKENLEQTGQISNIEQKGDPTGNQGPLEAGDLSQQAEPEGGINGFRKRVANSFQTPSVDEEVKASVKVRFIVDENGNVSDIKILEESHPKFKLSQELIRVIKKSGRWKPGISKAGGKVASYFVLPIAVVFQPEE